MEVVGATSTELVGNPANGPGEGSGSTPANADPLQGIRRAESIETYESQRSTALWAARLIGALHSLCKFLTLCSLTWATVVLLGAFVASLQFFDYTMVSCLLLLEAFRLASAVFFTQLLTRALAHLSQNPKQIDHDKDFHHRRALRARLLSCFLQALLILPSFIGPSLRLGGIGYEIPADLLNLQNSLLIFYILVVINASISLISLVCSGIAYLRLSDSSEQSILRYYDEVLLNALKSGVVRADDFDFFDFAYTMLGRDYARNVQSEAVVKDNRKLLKYLYTHRQGVDYLQIYLDSDKAPVRQAAANMVGLWADPNWGLDEKNIKLPGELLTKLADRLGTGQVGWAACNSFGGLARRDPEFLIKTVTSSRQPVLDVLAELVDGSSSRSLTAVRTLVLFYNNYLQGRHPNGPLPKKIEEMVPELKKLLSGSKVQRLRVLSAYLLYLLGKFDAKSCMPLVKDIRPKRDRYFFRSEVDMLQHFYAITDDKNVPPFPKIHEDMDTLKHPAPPSPLLAASSSPSPNSTPTTVSNSSLEIN